MGVTLRHYDPAMARPQLLADDQVNAAVADLPNWTRDGAHLRRSFLFANFADAFGFMATIAIVAERMDHHPEWSNVYNRVDVGLTTHDAGGITELDLQLATAMNAAARSKV